MKYVVFLASLVIIHYGVIEQNKKETVTIFFDIYSKEKCLLDIEGQGYTHIKKYRKTKNMGKVRYNICGEKFDLMEKKDITMDSTEMKAICPVDLSYLVSKKEDNVVRQNPFGKIFLIEKVDENRFLKREVHWVDEWSEVD